MTEIIMSIASPLAILLGALVAFFSLRYNQRYNRRRETLAYSLTRNKDYLNSRLKIEKIFSKELKEGTPVAIAVINKVKEVEGERIEPARELRYLFAHWESMALAIRNSLISEEIAYEMVGHSLASYIKVFESYIKDKQMINSRMFENVDWLYRGSRKRVIFRSQLNWSDRIASDTTPTKESR